MTRGPVAVLSPGVWRLRHLIREVTDWEPVFLGGNRRGRTHDVAAVAGWGHKQTAHSARRLAEEMGKPYIAIEDGFIRSVRPGRGELPLSLVFDRAGVHYDPTKASELERLIAKAAATPRPSIEARAEAAIARIRELGVSKYNAGRRLSAAQMGLGRAPRGGRVLVVDQTVGDGSVLCGSAGPETFEDMLGEALRDHPDAQVIVKTHPEVMGGRKRGYLSHVASERIHVVDFEVNPWSLIDIVDHVYVVSSQLGFEALLGGCKVTCFGGPFYAGWGLTDDRQEFPRRRARPTLEQLFAAFYLDYARYIDPLRLKRIDIEDAIDRLAWRRDMALSACIRKRALGHGYRVAEHARAWLG